MFIPFCKAKITGVKVTETNVHYDGSMGVDSSILEAAGILPYQMILGIDLENGNRFETYTIPKPAGSGILALYGGTARLGKAGDELIILSQVFLSEDEARFFKGPRVVKLKSGNKL